MTTKTALMICALSGFGFACGSPSDAIEIDAGDCSGCLADDGSCVPGTSASACGVGGGSCRACSGDEACDQGTCVVLGCGPDTCDGCCSGDTCLAGNSAAACGGEGAACVDCGDGFGCEGGACQVALDSRWDVTIVSGTVSETNAANETWDPTGGLPDLHVDVFIGLGDQARKVTSGTKDNTLSPVWNEIVLTDVTARVLLDRLLFRPIDSDFDTDDVVGECQVSLDSGLFDGSNHTLDCPRDVQNGQAGFTLTYRLTLH
jgi:hypothetical protein